MFTGIIKTSGKIESIEEKDGGAWLGVNIPEVAKKTELGGSVSINGACLTTVKIDGDVVYFGVMPQTIQLSTVGQLNSGDTVNVESPLEIGDELGGHFVYGHVDGVGDIKEIIDGDSETRMRIELPEELMKYMSPRGSVTVDGISLTIAELDEDSITVALTQFTMEHTTLVNKSTGDRVNIEADMMMKQIEKIMKDKYANE